MDKEHLLNLKNRLDNNGDLCGDTFSNLSKIYNMTTENIYGFLKDSDLKDKSVLTVTGSGDQMLNAYLLGAKNVTCFDINPNTFYHAKLKKTAVCNMSFGNFLAFFGIQNRRFPTPYGIYDYRLFQQLKECLDVDTKAFYELLYDKCRNNFSNKIYYSFSDVLIKLEQMNGYLNKESYQELAEKLENKDVEFIESDVTKLKEKIDGRKYDMILLSNISDYIQRIYPANPLENYRDLIVDLSECLNIGGTIQLGYIYNYYITENEYIPFRIKRERQHVFTTDKFHSKFVDAYRGSNFSCFDDNKDQVIFYQKYLSK